MQLAAADALRVWVLLVMVGTLSTEQLASRVGAFRSAEHPTSAIHERLRILAEALDELHAGKLAYDEFLGSAQKAVTAKLVDRFAFGQND